MSYKPINIKLRVCEMGYSFVIVIVYVTNLLTNVWAFNTIVVASMGGGWPHAGSRGPALSPGLGPHCVVVLGRSLCSHSASLHPGV